MDRDIALRIDSMLRASRVVLTAVSDYMLNNIAEDDQRKEFILLIGKSMGETIEISNALYDMYPDIVPKELRPPETPPNV